MRAFHLYFLVLLASLIVLSACSQQTDCETTLKQVPYFVRLSYTNVNYDSINKDYQILNECGNLDSVDCELFNGPILGSILVSESSKKTQTEITYQDLLDLISRFKTQHKTEYEKLYKGTQARMKIQDLRVNLAEFESLRQDFIVSRMKNEDIDNFKAFLEKNKKDWTYKEAVNAFSEDEESSVKSTEPLEFPELKDLNSALAEAKNANKNCLIYFSGWACVNARKFESQLLTDPAIREKIQNHFVYKVAYVDSRQKSPDGKGTVGESFAKLQREKFKSLSQPTLFVVSPDGRILAEWDYEKGPEAFQKFLEQGISK